MRIFFYQAECGDAFRISYLGDDNKMHNILIDSGYERTFSHVILEEISELLVRQESIDLWIISHIHDDHIGGVIRYLSAIKSGQLKDIVLSWFYNAPRSYTITQRDLENISAVKSIGQGDKLYNYLSKIGKIPNYDIVAGVHIPMIAGMTISILSPTPQKLAKLRQKYFSTEIPLQRNEVESISTAAKAKGYDYNIKLEDFDLDKWKEDTNEENGSSISVLTSLGGKNILWLADSHPSVIASSLKKLGYSAENKIKCEWVKVTHHGSKGNNSNELYDLIDCENYLMSVNGENIHYLPNKDSMARIIRNRNRSSKSFYRFYFTYDNAVLRSVFDCDGPEAFKKWNFEVHYLSNGKLYAFDI